MNPLESIFYLVIFLFFSILYFVLGCIFAQISFRKILGFFAFSRIFELLGVLGLLGLIRWSCKELGLSETSSKAHGLGATFLYIRCFVVHFSH